jgi:hypothetical protein
MYQGEYDINPQHPIATLVESDATARLLPTLALRAALGASLPTDPLPLMAVLNR